MNLSSLPLPDLLFHVTYAQEQLRSLPPERVQERLGFASIAREGMDVLYAKRRLAEALFGWMRGEQ